MNHRLTTEDARIIYTLAGTIGRHQYRDRAIIQMMYSYGLRASEAINLKWSDICFYKNTMCIPSFHPRQLVFSGIMKRTLSVLNKDRVGNNYVYTSEREGQLTPSCIRKMLSRAGNMAGIPFNVTPGILRDLCASRLIAAGYKVSEIKECLGWSGSRAVKKHYESDLYPEHLEIVTHLTNSYIKNNLMQRCKLSHAPLSLIQAKRQHLLITRRLSL